MIGLILPIFLRLGLSQRLAKVAAYIALGVAVIALCGALWLFVDSREKADDTANQQIGRQQERAETTAITLDRVEQGNQAREEIRAPGHAGDCARYTQCLRSARNGAQCQRFLPAVQEGHGVGCPGSVSE